MMRFFSIFVLCVAGLLPVFADDNTAEFVSYEKFGAKGDGINDDQKAIVSAHAYANKHNLPVKGKAGARYYIGSGSAVAVIKTDTDFNNAEFIIDDFQVPYIEDFDDFVYPGKFDFDVK